MKKTAYIFSILFAMLSVISCNQDMEYDAGSVKPVEMLEMPTDNYYVELMSSNGTPISFSWTPTTVSDGMPPMYELVFYTDATSGKEVKRLSAGVKTSLAVSHKDLNEVMNVKGVQPGATGDIYWSVIASRATTEAPGHPAPRKLTLKRFE